MPDPQTTRHPQLVKEPIEQTFHKARLKPLDWQVDCPVCGNVVIVDACENNDASWHADNGDQFPQCDECGALMEVLPVQVVEIAS